MFVIKINYPIDQQRLLSGSHRIESNAALGLSEPGPLRNKLRIMYLKQKNENLFLYFFTLLSSWILKNPLKVVTVFCVHT
jgi:hypothetical protein